VGREAACRARFEGQSSRGKALLETTELVFRGDFRVVIPLHDIRSLDADASALTVSWGARDARKKQTLVLELGADARKWAERIRNPPSRLDKLGVKATSTVALIGGKRACAADEDLRAFVAEVEARGARVVKSAPTGSEGDLVVFLVVEAREDLAKVAELVGALRTGGALWTLRRKGAGAAVTEGDVRSAARGAGLADVKVAAFSDERTADKFVVPIAARTRG
jgi:hypothetical protein